MVLVVVCVLMPHALSAVVLRLGETEDVAVLVVVDSI